MARTVFQSNQRLPAMSRCFSIAVLALLCALVLTGCVRRRLTVRTNPAGAQVFVDNKEIGASPASTSFIYYGTREIRVIKDGYETQVVRNSMWPPWYDWPPLEIVSENLWPGELRDERVVDIQLTPLQVIPESQLLSRADALRTGAASGTVTSLPGAMPGFIPPTAPNPATNNRPLFGVPGEGIYGQPATTAAPLPPANYPPAAGSPGILQTPAGR